MLFKNKKLLIFDYDGTIADTSTIHKEAFKRALSNLNLKYNYKDLAGLKTEDAIKKIFETNQLKLPDSIPNLTARKRKISLKIMTTKLKLMPSFDSFIHLAKQYFILSVVSSGSRESINFGLKKFKLHSLFENIITSADVKFAKPSPDGFLHSLELTEGIKKEEALIFEDSDSGIEAARLAGIDVVDVRNVGWRKLEKILRATIEK